MPVHSYVEGIEYIDSMASSMCCRRVYIRRLQNTDTRASHKAYKDNYITFGHCLPLVAVAVAVVLVLASPGFKLS